MARLGKQISPSLHGHFASPCPNSFRPSYPLADSFPPRIRPRSVTFPMSFCDQIRPFVCFHTLYLVKEGVAPNRSLIWKKGVHHGEGGKKYIWRDEDHRQLLFGCAQAGQRNRVRWSLEHVRGRIVCSPNRDGYRLGRGDRTQRDHGSLIPGPGLPKQHQISGRAEQNG